MIRSNSNMKWKQVLGFDEGISPTSSIPSQHSDDSESDISQLLPLARPRYRPNFPRLPRDVTFTRTGINDILLSPSSPAPSPRDLKPLPDPPPLFYISVQEDPALDIKNPEVMLHSGPKNSSSIISFAKFHQVSLVTDIVLCPRSSQDSNRVNPPNFSFPTPMSEGYQSKPRLGFKSEKLFPTGGVFTTEKYAFYHSTPYTRGREKFEWRHSSGPFLRTMDGVRESGGLKLIRLKTGETVAVYAGLGFSSRTVNPKRVVGMFRFLGYSLGDEFSILAIMSILIIVERGRRAIEANRVAFGIE